MSDLFSRKMKALGEAFQQEINCEENDASFLIDDIAYDFSFESASGQVLVFAVLGSIEMVSADRKNMIFDRLLKAQFCFVESGGFTFGVDPDSTMINLQARIDINGMEDLVFTKKMECFVNYASSWAKILKMLIVEREGEERAGETSDFAIRI